MAYAIPDIIQWAKGCQAYAAIGEAEKRAKNNGSINTDLDVQLYVERPSLEYSYDQEPSSDATFQIGQWVLALCGVYLFGSQQAQGGGGSITPVTPGGLPEPIEFEVTTGSLIPENGTTVNIPQFIGFNLIFVRNGITQSTINQGGSYYSWNRTTGDFILLNGSAQLTELFQLYPIS